MLLFFTVFVYYILTVSQTVLPMVFNQPANAQEISLQDLFEKISHTNQQELVKVYEELIDFRKSFFKNSLTNFQHPNAIEKVPNHNTFLKVYNNNPELVKEQIAKDALTTHAIVNKKVIDLINDFIALIAAAGSVQLNVIYAFEELLGTIICNSFSSNCWIEFVKNCLCWITFIAL